MVDAAVLDAAVLPAIRDGGKLATVRGWSGPSERGITILPVRVTSYVENGEALDLLGRLVAEKGDARPAGDRLLRTHRPLHEQRGPPARVAGGGRERLRPSSPFTSSPPTTCSRHAPGGDVGRAPHRRAHQPSPRRMQGQARDTPASPSSTRGPAPRHIEHARRGAQAWRPRRRRRADRICVCTGRVVDRRSADRGSLALGLAPIRSV